MLSRAAESFFWLGRYLERAEYTSRFTNVHYGLILEIADLRDQLATWRHHLDITGELPLAQELCQPLTTRTILEFIALHPQNPNSIKNLIQAARTNARGIQDQLSSEVWDQINEFYWHIKTKTASDFWASPYEFLEKVFNTSYMLDGVFGSTMLHDEGWNFYRLGKNVERAGQTARLLEHPVLSKVAHEPGEIAEFHHCLALLKSASAFEAYRKCYTADLVPRRIVEFLLFHDKFPRSVRFCAEAISRLLDRVSGPLPRSETRELKRLAGQFAADLQFGSLDEIFRLGLTTFLSQIIYQLDHITNIMGRAFFRTHGYSELPAPDTRLWRRPSLHVVVPSRKIVEAVVAIRHQFTYEYTEPVSQVTTVVRLAPPQHYGFQRRLDLRWHIDPPADYRHFTDAFGNLVWQLDHAFIERTIFCRVEMRVATRAFYEEDGALVPQGVVPQETDCTVHPAEFTKLTTLVNSSDALLQLARRAKERALPHFELADSLMHQVYAHMHYKPGSTHVGTTAAEAFEQASGVCQDYAHIMLALCRLAGLPARYVSGYLPGEGQMHAWVEVLCPIPPDSVFTWVPFDPTHNRRCDERYATVAVGRDYQDVAPTSGYYSGTSPNTLSVNVSVTLESQSSGTQWFNVQGSAQELSSSAADSQQQ